MKSKLILLAVCCALSLAAAEMPSQWQEEPRKGRAGVYALEGLGALPGIAGCGCLAVGGTYVFFVAALGLAFNDGSGDLGMATVFGCAALVSAAALPAVAAIGTAQVGGVLGEDGSTGWAIGGAYAGAAVGTGLGFLGYYVGSRTNGLVGIPFYVVGGLTIPAGAVAGYNLGIKREVPSHAFGDRLDAPFVALTNVELPDHSVEYGVRVQLASLRF